MRRVATGDPDGVSSTRLLPGAPFESMKTEKPNAEELREKARIRASEWYYKNRHSFTDEQKDAARNRQIARREKAKASMTDEQLAAQKLANKAIYQKRKAGFTDKHKADAKAYMTEYQVKNRQSLKVKGREYAEKNKERLTAARRIWVEKNREKMNEKSRKWCEENPEKRKEVVRNSAKRKRAENPERYKSRVREYVSRKRASDPIFKMKMSIRNLAVSALKAQGLRKRGSITSLLGCSPQFFRTWITSKLPKGMTLENHGRYTWHIDHIIPLASFDLSDPNQLAIACHYTNLQPMEAMKNMIKKDKITHPQMSLLLNEC